MLWFVTLALVAVAFAAWLERRIHSGGVGLVRGTST